MKTLTINGLVFTDQPPTKEGFWLYNNGTDKRWCYFGTFLDKEKICRVYNTGEDEERKSWEFGGFWYELIPRGVFAEEVEKAWEEGYLDGAVRKDNAWPESRAKLVSEGKEPKV